jgi:hypothetical protein
MLLLARTTPVGEVKKKTEGLSVFLVNLRNQPRERLEIRPIKAMINHNTVGIHLIVRNSRFARALESYLRISRAALSLGHLN